ncbi:MAG: GNAT family N-acetyltransferase [Bacteroidota bacterium]
MKIRRATKADVTSIFELNQELGYRSSASLVEDQLTTILSRKDHVVFVATNQEEVIGYVHGFLAIRLTTAPFVEIGALIVKETHRHKGIGSKLIDYVEQHMNEVETTRVRCNVNRTSAHEFYLALGFTEKKEQKVFEREQKTPDLESY